MQATFRLIPFANRTIAPAPQPVVKSPVEIDPQLLKLVAGGASQPVAQVVVEDPLPKGGW